MSIILTNKQELGLRTAVERYKNNDRYTVISGYAGSGKTTLVKFIIAALDIDPIDVGYIAYTGKAALVLKSKGNQNAVTAHKLLYKSFPKKDGTFLHVPRSELSHSFKLIVVDEISMLPKEMWHLLLSHRIHVIALGDPGQLPPIGENNGVLDSPHVFLDEIMRQAQESEIIRLTMDIRDGKPLKPFAGKEVQILHKKDVVSGMYTWADQIIAGRNTTRKNINATMRKMLYGVENNLPIVKDKIICLRNDWDLVNEEDDILVNGLIGTVTSIKLKEHPFLHPQMLINFLPEQYEVENNPNLDSQLFYDLNVDYKLFMQGYPTVNEKNFRKFPKVFRPKEFDFGYCITCHKSQGSEYGKVLVFEEHLSQAQHSKWLYTATTRAHDKLTLVMED